MVDHEKNIDDSGNQNEMTFESSEKLKNLRKTLTNQEIISQCAVFLNAGYDTTHLTLGYIAYNLALNPDHQQTLCEEIDKILEENVK